MLGLDPFGDLEHIFLEGLAKAWDEARVHDISNP